jgi:Ca2+-binding EF-hand superfamily protein
MSHQLTRTNSKDILKKDSQLVSAVTKNLGATPEGIREILTVWKKRNQTSISSVDQLQASLDEVGFWKNFDAVGLGSEAFATISNQCPEFKKESAAELFHIFDKDHDGQISAKEFLTGVLESQTKDPRKEAELLFEAWDEDNSGTLSKGEVKKLWTTRRHAEFTLTAFTTRVLLHSSAIKFNVKYLEMFPDLTKEKLEAFAQQHASKGATDYITYIKAEEKAKIDTIVEKIFEKADTNKNGALSKDEFLNFFCDEETMSKIREMVTEDEKASKILENAVLDLTWQFLDSSSDEVAKKCAAKLKDFIQNGESDDLHGIPPEIWKKIHTSQ